MKLNKKGFTMVELLVVLLIIGILAAIATPLYLANTQRAKASEAVATMGMIRQAEREYFTKHNVYLAVAAGNLKNDPGDANPGLGIEVGMPQYFGNACYGVVIGNPPASTSGKFTSPPAQDFVITVDGSLQSQTPGAANSSIKPKDVVKYKLEMDNSGRIFVTYDTGATTVAWVEY